MNPGYLISALALAAILSYSQSAAHAQEPEQAVIDQISSAFRSGRVNAALVQARQAVARFPKSSQLHQLLGAAAFKNGLNEEARSAFRRAIDLDAAVPQNYYDLALVSLSERRYREAVQPLESYIRLDPQSAEGHLLLGRAYHNLNETEAAIDQFKKALALSPRLPLAHYHLGFAYQSQGNVDGALEEFKKEIEFNPKSYDAYWLAGEIELRRGDLKPATDLFRRAAELKSQPYEAYYGLGRVFLAEKHLPDAEDQLRRALQLRPDDVKAHYALAQMYQQMGDTKSADREFQICSHINARRQAAASGIAGVRH